MPLSGVAVAPNQADTVGSVLNRKVGDPLGLLVFVVLVFVFFGLPSYVIGQRRGVSDAWVAFIPIAGPTMVLLWSIDRPGWMVILGLLPLVNLVIGLWLLFALPAAHDRSLWWGVGCLVPVVGMYSYAFTLSDRSPSTTRVPL